MFQPLKCCKQKKKILKTVKFEFVKKMSCVHLCFKNHPIFFVIGVKLLITGLSVFRKYMTKALRQSLSVLTGREYSRMARKRITMMRRMSPMKRHLNLRHTMNFMVLHGLVNQKKEVSGRLIIKNKRTNTTVRSYSQMLCSQT